RRGSELSGMASTPRETRRRFLRRAVYGSAAFTGGGILWSRYGERHWPQVYRVTVPVPGLPAELLGFRICQLSDLHRGVDVTEEFLHRCVALANSVSADL